MNALVIGVDCATVDSKIGLALAAYHSGKILIQKATLCGPEHSAANTVADWLSAIDGSVLLAIDAPLGWPEAMGRTLVAHRAGEKIAVAPNEMFRRGTDRFIQSELYKTPLDVGADRIARTAHAALRLLSDIRTRVGRSIPLAWDSRFSGVAAIEVYPAATLVAHGFRSAGYKAKAQLAERREIITSLRGEDIDIGTHESALEDSADTLDAAVCLLAAKDFLESRATCPANRALAEYEGWIGQPLGKRA
jgi:predicted RNase H-like nuclease